MKTQQLECESCSGTLKVNNVPDDADINKLVELVHLAAGNHATVLRRNGFCTGYPKVERGHE